MKSKEDILTDLDLIIGRNDEVTDDTHSELVNEVYDYIEKLNELPDVCYCSCTEPHDILLMVHPFPNFCDYCRKAKRK